MSSTTTGTNGRTTAPSINSVEGRKDRADKLQAKLGIDLFARYPRERVRYLMDPRPLDWKAMGWRSVSTEEERVEYCVLYHSLCWPVCLEYAVRIDADDNIELDRWGRPRPLTRERITAILNLKQQNVWDAADRLIRKKRLRLEDGSLYFEAKPSITLEQRKDICTDVLSVTEAGGIPPSVYRRFDQKLKDLAAPEDIRTDVFGRVLSVRTRFLGGLKDLRYQERIGYDEVSTALGNLSVQSWNTELTSTSSERTPAPSDTPAVQSLAPDSPNPGQLDQLYAAGLGKGALAKLPSPRPAVHAGQAIAQACPFLDEEIAGKIYSAVLAVNGKVTPEETIELIGIKVGQVRAKIEAGKIESVPGLLLAAVPKMIVGKDPPMLTQARELARTALERKERELQSQEETRRWAEQVLANVNSGDSERDWAREILGLNVKAAGGGVS